MQPDEMETHERCEPPELVLMAAEAGLQNQPAKLAGTGFIEIHPRDGVLGAKLEVLGVLLTRFELEADIGLAWAAHL